MPDPAGVRALKGRLGVRGRRSSRRGRAELLVVSGRPLVEGGVESHLPGHATTMTWGSPAQERGRMEAPTSVGRSFCFGSPPSCQQDAFPQELESCACELLALEHLDAPEVSCAAFSDRRSFFIAPRVSPALSGELGFFAFGGLFTPEGA